MIVVETEDYARISAGGKAAQRFTRRYPGWIWFLLGLLGASAGFLAARPYWEDSTSGLELGLEEVSLPQRWEVGPNGISTIGAALDRARPEIRSR